MSKQIWTWSEWAPEMQGTTIRNLEENIAGANNKEANAIIIKQLQDESKNEKYNYLGQLNIISKEGNWSVTATELAKDESKIAIHTSFERARIATEAMLHRNLAKGRIVLQEGESS